MHHITRQLTKEEQKRLRKLQARLAEIEARKPTGELYIRHRRIDDHNQFWRAGWPISDYGRELWREHGWGDWWVLCDRGTDNPVFGTYYLEEAKRVLRLYNQYGRLITYNPDDYPGCLDPHYEPLRKPGMRRHPH